MTGAIRICAGGIIWGIIVAVPCLACGPRLRWVAARSANDRPLLTGAIFVAIICAAGGAHASY